MSCKVKSAHSDGRTSELDLLKIIPSDLKLFDNISVSSGQESELSGPFSDYEKSEGFVEKRKSNELEKTDLYSYFSFSDEFKTAMESVKRESKGSESEKSGEDSVEEEIPGKESKIQIELEKKVAQLLRETRFVLREKRKSDEIEEKSQDGKVRKSKLKEEKKVYEEDDYFDTMSGYWRMLSAYDDFKISHPDYNAYENETPHWMETKPIALHVMGNSRKKCLEWLKENFETY